MSKLLFFLILLTGCQDYNSNSADKDRYGNVNLDGNAEFQTAYAIIQNRCTNCHNSQIHSSWASYTSNELWINSGGGRVVPGDPQSSLLISRIINSGETHSNMPLGGSALPNDEYDALVQWIENIQ